MRPSTARVGLVSTSELFTVDKDVRGPITNLRDRGTVGPSRVENRAMDLMVTVEKLFSPSTSGTVRWRIVSFCVVDDSLEAPPRRNPTARADEHRDFGPSNLSIGGVISGAPAELVPVIQGLLFDIGQQLQHHGRRLTIAVCATIIPAFEMHTSQGKLPMYVMVIVESNSDLSEVIRALGAPGSFSSGLDRWQQ